MTDKPTAGRVREIVIEILGSIPKGYKVSRPPGFNAWALSNKDECIDLGNTVDEIVAALRKVKSAFKSSVTEK